MVAMIFSSTVNTHTHTTTGASYTVNFWMSCVDWFMALFCIASHKVIALPTIVTAIVAAL